jgi:3',5'-cyclic AMP phosphodiesterase CpdA
MKKNPLCSGRALVLTAVIALTLAACSQSRKKDDFTFVFMTDIHLTQSQNAVAGFTQAINTINGLHPDFVITGGDLIMDALGQQYSAADSLYNLYISTVRKLTVPVYNTMGNHEIYGILRSSGADTLNPEYGEKMFEKRLGKSYYAFNHKGWKFIVLNSIEDTRKDDYIGKIDDVQMEWIKKELQETDHMTPIAISTHIPFITANTQKYAGTTVANDSSAVIYNGKEVLDLFMGYNLKLVLQGHLHTVEDIFIDGIHFITGGAVSAAWWTGPNKDFEEGFMLISVKKDDFSWKYIDYGWDVKK